MKMAKRIGLDFGVGRELEYSVEDMVNLDLAYATTIHKAMGSEYETVIMPLLKSAHRHALPQPALYRHHPSQKARGADRPKAGAVYGDPPGMKIVKRNTLLGTRIGMYYKAYAKRAGIPVPAALEEELKYAGSKKRRKVQKIAPRLLFITQEGVYDMNDSNAKTMYETVPAAAELNKVPGFDPLKFLRRTKDTLKLDLPYQKLWFRMAHPNGRMRLTALRITEQMAIFEAKVFLDRSDAEPFSMSTAQQTTQDSRDFVKAAQNEALSQALTDAGFGIQLISAGAQGRSDGEKRRSVCQKGPQNRLPGRRNARHRRRSPTAPLRGPMSLPRGNPLPAPLKRRRGRLRAKRRQQRQRPRRRKTLLRNR